VDKKNKNNVFAAFALAATMGLNLAICIIVGLAAGIYLDGLLETQPWLTVAGIILGVISGLWSVYKKIINF
jgi:ATP synthase protein I